MKTLQQKIAFCLVLAVMFCLILTPLAAQGASQDTINNLTAKQERLRTQKIALESELSELSKDKAKAVDQKVLLEQKINVLSQQIQVSQQTIQQLDQQITEKQTELTQAEEAEAAYEQIFRQRIRAMEERGNLSYFGVLFQAGSFSDLLDRMNVIAEVVEYDNQVMEQMAQAREAVANAKAGLEESQQRQQAVLAEQKGQQTQLQAEQAKVQTVLTQIQSQASRYGQDLAALEATEDQVAQELAQAEAAYAQQLEAERQAEAKRRAEAKRQEEARRQAAQQQQQQQQQQQKPQQNQSGSGNAGQDASQSSGLLWPVPSSHRVSSPFGPRIHPITHQPSFHRGIDIPAGYGADVKASLGGVVVISKYHSSYGNYVVVSHSNGMRTLYAHLSSRLVSPGETVSQGQTIGCIGSTGSSTGNHLHYETWTGSSSSSRTNPMNYF